MVWVIRFKTCLWAIEYHHTVIHQIGQIMGDRLFIEGKQEIKLIFDGIDRFVPDSDLNKIMPPPDSGFHILIYERIVTMTRKYLSNGEADGLHPLSSFAPYSDTYIHIHGFFLLLLWKKEGFEINRI
jgi:hypothetical protein